MKLRLIPRAKTGKQTTKLPMLTFSLQGGRIGFTAEAIELLKITLDGSNKLFASLAIDEEENDWYLVLTPEAVEGSVEVIAKKTGVQFSHSAAVQQVLETLPAKDFAQAVSFRVPLAKEATEVPAKERVHPKMHLHGLLTAGAKVLRTKKPVVAQLAPAAEAKGGAAA
jgi:hypothetical protein